MLYTLLHRLTNRMPEMTTITTQNDPIVTVGGKQWRVVATGVTRQDGMTFCHLASTTEFRQQRNGANPVQCGEWLNLGRECSLVLDDGY